MVWWIQHFMGRHSANFQQEFEPAAELPRSSATDVESPECPRCGYGLTGLVQSWAVSCPLEGRCSECGLVFAWRDALNPQFSFPRWCVEGGNGLDVALRSVKTLFMILRPWRFWRELQMHHPLRVQRIALVLLLCVPLFHVIFATSAGIGTYRSASNASLTGGPGVRNVWTRVGRAAAWPYSSPNVISPNGPVYRASYRYTFQFHVAGWRAVRFGIHDSLIPDDELIAFSERGFSFCLATLLAPVGFLLLPASRRIARVRWRHILRITCYSLVMAIIPIGFDCYAQTAGLPRRWVGEVVLAMTGLAALALVSWWAFATSRYLRIAHAWGVAAFVVAFAYLVQRFAFEAIDFAIAMSM